MKAKTIIKQLLDQEQTGQWVETPDFQDTNKTQWLIDYFGMKTFKAGTIEPNTMYVVTWGDNRLNGAADAILEDRYNCSINLYKVEE